MSFFPDVVKTDQVELAEVNPWEGMNEIDDFKFPEVAKWKKENDKYSRDDGNACSAFNAGSTWSSWFVEQQDQIWWNERGSRQQRSNWNKSGNGIISSRGRNPGRTGRQYQTRTTHA